MPRYSTVYDSDHLWNGVQLHGKPNHIRTLVDQAKDEATVIYNTYQVYVRPVLRAAEKAYVRFPAYTWR